MLVILLPVDGSESSNRAVDYLLDSASLYRDAVEVHLLNVQLPIASGSVKLFVSHDAIESYYHDEGSKVLEPVRQRMEAAGVQYVHHIGLGEPAEVITRYARDKRCDQIWMGTRGLGQLSSVLMGSVAAKVIHLADRPVLLLK
jgi:nucleotide-binding universal stress UspA family protein